MQLQPLLFKRYYFLCLLISFVLQWTVPGTARNTDRQALGYSVRQYTDENGLPQNSVKDIAPDKDGFIWLTTENGLVRFDGNRFKVFNKSNLNVSTNRFGWFQPSMQKTNHHLFVRVSNTEFFRIEGGKVYADSLYYAKFISKIPFVKESRLKITFPVSSPNIQWTSITQEKFIVPVSNETGRYYLCYNNKIEYYDNWEKKTNISKGFSNFWYIFRFGNKLMSFNKNGTVTQHEPSSSLKTNLKIGGDILGEPDFRKSPDKIKIYWNNTTDQTFLYLNKKLYLIERGRSGEINTKLLLKGFDLEATSILSIYYDRQYDRVFLGSHSKGLFISKPNVFSTAGFDKKIQGNIFYQHASTNDSTIITPQGYKIMIDGLKKPVTVSQNPIIAPLNLYLLTVDPGGFQWGAFDNHLYKFAPEGKYIAQHWFIKQKINLLFYRKKDRLIWMVTEEGQIYTIDPSKNKPSPEFLFQGPQNPKWLEKVDQTLWIGNPVGLYQIDLNKSKIEIIQETKNLNIRSLYLSRLGELWLTTYENGFFLYQNKTLTKFPSDKNHFLETSHCIVEDKKGYFWITTNKGLFQVAKSELLQYAKTRSGFPYYHYYSRESGFKTNEFNGGCQPCALKLQNGYVSLPSVDGLVLFLPEKIKAEQPTGVLFVDNILVGNKPYPHTKDSLNLPFNPDLIRISVAVPYFGEPANLNIFYAVSYNGAPPRTWISLDHDKAIQLSNLPSGNHKLHIKKQNGFGAANQTHTSFSINIAKAWYETLWFRLLATVCILAVIIMFNKFLNRNLVRKNRALEEAVEKRMESLKQTLHALKGSETELTRQVRIQSRMIASLTHDVRSPLMAVTNISYAIASLIREEKYDLVAEIGKSIGDSTERIGATLDSTLDYIKVQLSQKNIQFEKVNLHDLISQKIRLFSLSSKKQGNVFTNNIPKEVSVKNNPYLLGIIINNLLDNANKNTMHGVILTHCESIDNKLIVKVSDTGYGIPDHLIEWLNRSEYETPDKEFQHLKKVSGVGLILVKEIARMMDITLFAERNQKGSSVSIFLEKF